MKTLSMPKKTSAAPKSAPPSTKKASSRAAKNSITTTGAAAIQSENVTATYSSLQEDEIAQRAYQIWQSNGCQEGCEEENWHQAVRELHNQVPA